LEFNEDQKRVLAIRGGRHACMAAAGSGKTEVLVERLRQALSEGVDPKKVLCLTFTTRAAQSMVSRVKGKVESQKIKNTFIGNTHALAVSMVLKERVFSNTYSLCSTDLAEHLWRLAEANAYDFISKKLPALLGLDNIHNWGSLDYSSIADDEYWPLRIIILEHTGKSKINLLSDHDFNFGFNEAILLADHLLGNLKGPENPYDKINLYSLYSIIQPITENVKISELHSTEYIKFVKEKLKTTLATSCLSGLLENNNDMILIVILVVAFEYSKLKKELSLYDFNDAMVKSISLDCQQYAWVQIDECQDLSPIQWLLIEKHTVNNPSLFLFGDVNQSIYRFMGASIDLTKDKMDGSTHELPKNYRSPKNLVNFYNSYMEFNFPKPYEFKIQTDKPEKAGALILLQRTYQFRQYASLVKHAQKVVSKKSNVAFLCATNASVDKVATYMSSQNIKYFRISQNNIMTSAPALDFMAFIGAMADENDSLSWARILWRFGAPSSLKDETGETRLTPQLNALKIVAELNANCGRTVDFLVGENLYEHVLSKLKRGYKEGYTFFDTETTGLSDDADVIQIASVAMKDSVQSDELDLYCSTSQLVGDSETIHKISDQFLAAHGVNQSVQFQKFISFSQGSISIAHNLDFDENIINKNIQRTSPNLQSGFDDIAKLCSLKLSRRLHPHLKSHKLGDLLKEFKLSGENSHNALDDVKAGANYIEHIKESVKKSSESLDAYIDKNEGVFSRLVSKFKPLYDAVSCLHHQKEVNLEDLFDMYFAYYKEQFPSDELKRLEELRDKLIPWSKEHLKPSAPNKLIKQSAKTLQLLNESDLITPEDKLIVSTIHKSKGLEFDCVIIPDVVSSAFPSYPISIMGDSHEKTNLIEEQRRLLYVAITRAKEQLVIGQYTTLISKWGKEFPVWPCQFISAKMYKTMHIIQERS
jgi:DNA helicase II / ATP-dependent DNA helicase PcrA